VDRELAGSAEYVTTYLTPKLVQHWAALLDPGERFGGQAELACGIMNRQEKGTSPCRAGCRGQRPVEPRLRGHDRRTAVGGRGAAPVL